MTSPRAVALSVVACGLACAPGAVAGGARDRTFIAVVAEYVGRVRAAERFTASSGGNPDAVQRQYDLARDFQEALTSAGATSRPCQRAANAARELAKAEVLQTEGYDLGDPEVVARGTRRIAAAFDRYTAGARTCKAGGRVLRSRLVALRSPVPAQVFFRSVRLQGRAPVGARWAVIGIDTRRPGCKGTPSKQIANRSFSMSLRLRPGRHAVTVAFCGGRRSAPLRVASARVPGVWVLAAAEAVATASRRESRSLDDRLARNARRFPGISAVWYQDLRTGVIASWNADAVFPAASTVKLGLLVAALGRFGLRSPVSYDLRAMGMWSSNLATNRLLAEVGGSAAGGSAAAQAALARMGATHSTFTGAYRVGSAVTRRVDQPPRISSRVTTARDLAEALYTLHAGALGAPPALSRLRLSRAEARFALGILLSSVPRRDNVGLFGPALGDTPAAQKQGWLSVARHTAAIVYSSGGPKILVLLTYGPNLTLATAQAYGRSVLRILRPR